MYMVLKAPSNPRKWSKRKRSQTLKEIAQSFTTDCNSRFGVFFLNYYYFPLFSVLLWSYMFFLNYLPSELRFPLPKTVYQQHDIWKWMQNKSAYSSEITRYRTGLLHSWFPPHPCPQAHTPALWLGSAVQHHTTCYWTTLMWFQFTKASHIHLY